MQNVAYPLPYYYFISAYTKTLIVTICPFLFQRFSNWIKIISSLIDYLPIGQQNIVFSILSLSLFIRLPTIRNK